jgi:hypothetical protein
VVTPSRAISRLRIVLLYVAVPALGVATAWRTFVEVRSEWRFGVTVAQGELKIHDFASHLTFAKTFWRGEGGYAVEDHRRVTERLAGRRLPYALPFGYAPTMLFVLGPLCPLPTGLGYVAWTLLGLGAVLWTARRYPSLAVPMVFISPVALGCWGLGQTAALTTAALLYLMHWDVTSEGARVARRDLILAAAVVWALTAKPPLAIAAVTALVAGRRLAIVAAALVLTAVATALLLPLLGKAGVADYLALLTHYDLDTAAPAFAWSLRPDSMANLRALLHVTFGVADGVASRLSTVLWLLASASIVVAAARRAIATEFRWSLAVLAYLLFCPHVSWTEELHLAVIVAALGAVTGPASIRGTGIALALAMVFLFPLPAFGAARVAAGFSVTALVAAMVIAVAWRSPSGKATQTAPASTA